MDHHHHRPSLPDALDEARPTVACSSKEQDVCLDSIVCAQPTVRWHTHRVRGSWVGKTVLDALATDVWPSARSEHSPRAAVEAAIASAAESGDVIVHVDQSGRSASPTTTKQTSSLGPCLAHGPAALRHVLALRQWVIVRTTVPEPAALDMGPIPIAYAVDLSRILEKEEEESGGPKFRGSDPGAHVLFAVDKPPSIPVHPGGRYVRHSVLGFLSQPDRRTFAPGCVLQLCRPAERGADSTPFIMDTHILADPNTAQAPPGWVEAVMQSVARSCDAIRTVGVLASPFDDARACSEEDAEPVRPVHRLDRGTSGVLLLATSAAVARLVGECIAAVGRGGGGGSDPTSATKHKVYDALLRGEVVWKEGNPPAAEGLVVSTPIRHHGRDLSARTRFIPLPIPPRAIAPPQACTPVQCLLEHGGRFHQIRRHAAELHHAVLGDAEAGDLGFWTDGEGQPWSLVCDVDGCRLSRRRLHQPPPVASPSEAEDTPLLALHARSYHLVLQTSVATVDIRIDGPPPWFSPLQDERRSMSMTDRILAAFRRETVD